MTKHRIGLLVSAVLSVVALSGLASTPAAAVTRLHLEATERAQTWRSPAPVDRTRPLRFQVRLNGHNITGRGRVQGTCHYSLLTRGLALEMTACGANPKEPVVIRYTGSVAFVFEYKVKPRY